MLTRGRSVQESVKGALNELESVVHKLQVPAVFSTSSWHEILKATLQDTKRAKDAATRELEIQLADLLARRCAAFVHRALLLLSHSQLVALHFTSNIRHNAANYFLTIVQR
jgi:hypothetical protein